MAARQPIPWNGWLAMGLGVVAGFHAWGSLQASAMSAMAQGALEVGRPNLALQHAGEAISADAYHVKANYTHWVALKRLGRWGELSQTTEDARSWHPEQAALLRLWAEAEATRGAPPGPVAEGLWRAFALDPEPRDSPGGLWFLTMRTSAAAWGESDPRSLEAARQIREWVLKDPRMPEPARVRALAEAEAILGDAGLPAASRRR